MAELLVVLEEDARRRLKRERVFLDRTNPLEVFDDVALIRKYRFPRSSILKLIEECTPQLQRQTKRNHALPVYSQVLAALRFYAKGTFQEDSGEITGISQPCVCRAISNVSKILANKSTEIIKFPNTEEELRQTMLEFSKIYGFPKIIGLIDGTHVRMRGPARDAEPLFVCRKGGHSISVQVICDHRMKFTGVVAKYGGSTNDAFIWKFCGLREAFISQPPKGWLLGDSGYPLEPWLMTPLLDPKSSQENAFNVSHKKTRNKIECTIGLWKSIFRCVDLSGGYLQYTPTKVCQIITATVVLHNMRRELRLQEDEEFYVETQPEEDDICPAYLQNQAITLTGRNLRSNLINSIAV